MNVFNDIISYLHSSSFGHTLLPFEIIALILSFLFLGAIIYFLYFFSKTLPQNSILLRETGNFLSYKKGRTRIMIKVWQKIRHRLDSNIEAEYKLAIIEADEFFSNVLKRMGYPGDNLEKQLVPIEDKGFLPNLNDVKKAYQVRNGIVHDPNYHLTLSEAQEVVNIYEQALKYLKVLGE